MYDAKRVSALLLSAFSLLIGLFYYLFFRENPLFVQWLGIPDTLHTPLFKNLFTSLPSFLHVFAFSLITWVYLEFKHRIGSILLWTAINIFFEFLQLLGPETAKILPSPLYVYAVHGTFDKNDFIAIVAAAIASYLTMEYLDNKENR